MEWFIFILLLPHFQPRCFEFIWTDVAYIFNVGKIVSVALVFILFIAKRKVLSPPAVILTIMEFWIFITTLLGDAKVLGGIFMGISVLAVMLIVEFYIDEETEALYRALLLCMELLIYTNLLSVLLCFPDGLYINSNNNPEYVLGSDNRFIVIIFCAICVALVYMLKYKRYLRSILLTAASVFTVFYTWSATAVVGMMTFGIVLALSILRRKDINYYLVAVVMVVIDLLLTVVRIMDKVEPVRVFITDFLHKKVTLSNRIYIWDRFYEMFQESPFFGHGYGTRIYRGEYSYIHPHNQYFYYLLIGGLLALCLFALMNILAGYKLMKFRSNAYSAVFVSVFAGWYMVYITEAYSSPLIYLCILLAWHIDVLGELDLRDKVLRFEY